ncbi:MAG: hypothetical protein WDM78_21815 [Puia sp.]
MTWVWVKPIQALSFLHHYKEHYGHLRALVVCPTTLDFQLGK